MLMVKTKPCPECGRTQVRADWAERPAEGLLLVTVQCATPYGEKGCGARMDLRVDSQGYGPDEPLDIFGAIRVLVQERWG